MILHIIIIIFQRAQCSWISGALNEHYLKFWALNRALNAKKQGTLKALLNPNFTSTKLSALVYNFRKEFERYKAGPVRREPCLVESSTEWTCSLPLSWVRWSTVTGCKSFFYRFFFFMVLVLSSRECCPSAEALEITIIIKKIVNACYQWMC